MIKRTILIGTLAALVLSAVAMGATVVGTKHDLSTYLTTGSQVCVFCHTPHGANTGTDLKGKAPLWNQTTSTTASYGTYDSNTFNASDLTALANGTYQVSLLCMSCHDGTVAPGSMYNTPNGNSSNPTIAKLTGSVNMGTDLADDHPVNFTYASSVSNGDTGLVTESTISEYLDPGGNVQCTSCHDPHDDTVDTDVDFMRVSLAHSALCTTCHSK